MNLSEEESREICSGTYAVLCEADGRYYKRKTIAEYTGRAVSTVSNWFKIGENTVERLLHYSETTKARRAGTRANNAGTQPQINIFDNTGRGYSYKQVAEITGRAKATIRLWFVTEGIDTLQGMKDRNNCRQRKAPRVQKQKTSKAENFSSGNCSKERGTVICKHFSECQNERVFSGKHHKRYRKDFSCFDGVKNRCFYQQSSGQMECTAPMNNGMHSRSE